MQLLSENAVLHLTAGFAGPFIVQAFAVRRDLYQTQTYHFCITDGSIYIGARYQYQHQTELQNYNLIQITATFTDRMHPISIISLDVVSTTLRKLVGNPPMTLQDYLVLQTKLSHQQLPRKMIKMNEIIDEPVVIKSIELRKGNRQFSNKTAKQSIKETSPKNYLQNDKRSLRLDSDSEGDMDEPQEHQKMSQSQDQKYQSQMPRKEIFQVKPQMKPEKKLEKSCVISDLYQRATGWVLLGRINFMSIVECQNGLFAANFILADQTGNEIKCVYFVAELQHIRQTLHIGSYYLLTGGQVKYSHKDTQLTLTFDRNSDIIAQPEAIFAPFQDEFIRIEQVLQKQHEEVVNVVGVIRRMKTKQQFKNKTKYTATLCDPLKRLQIDFMLFLNNGEKDIERGMVIVLHNFQIFKQQGIFRLNSTFKSYYFKENGQNRQGDLIDQFHQLIELAQWDHQGIVYRNVSMFAFTQRTVRDLKMICVRTEDERIYSALEQL